MPDGDEARFESRWESRSRDRIRFRSGLKRRRRPLWKVIAFPAVACVALIFGVRMLLNPFIADVTEENMTRDEVSAIEVDTLAPGYIYRQYYNTVADIIVQVAVLTAYMPESYAEEAMSAVYDIIYEEIPLIDQIDCVNEQRYREILQEYSARQIAALDHLVSSLEKVGGNMPLCAQARSYDRITKEVEVRNFNGIRASSGFDIEVEKSDGYGLELTIPSELEKYVTASVKSGELVLSFDMYKAPKEVRRRFSRGDWPLRAKVSCPEIESIHLSGAADMIFLDKFESASLSISASGASSLKKASFGSIGDLTMKVSGASHVEMDFSDEIGSSDIQCSGASNVYMVGGRYADCVVSNSGASDVYLEDVDMNSLKVVLSGASDFYADGTADYLDVDASGASSCNTASLKADRARVEASGASDVIVNAADVEPVNISSASSLSNRR
ncbi:MAG TPA: DUF2807 domain-containing protein [Candidatus Coprenecus stercoravium]|uniref:DUF2807 domain-containing protein n=1 Tax=Candidatus Coprenecus stercoravium TaxID=2840735 RepID=A0A9D2GQT2_9BACT|nr:DUF2807 domain-containing protein [Candidatus Coprenecus stercoravium]